MIDEGVGLTYATRQVRDPAPAPDGENAEERRADARYSCDPWIAIIFHVADDPRMAAGHIIDIGKGGAQIRAPSTCQVPLHRACPLHLTASYSESARQHGVEGLELVAEVVAIHWDELELVLHVRFDAHRGHWDRVLEFVGKIGGSGA